MKKSFNNFKNKKAEEGTTLGGTVVGVVIAVLCIGILLLLGVAIYNILNPNPDLPKAQASLNEVLNIVNSVQSNQVLNTMILNPSGWIFIYFAKQPGDTQNKICICKFTKPSSIDAPIPDFNQLCSKSGACLGTDKKVTLLSPGTLGLNSFYYLDKESLPLVLSISNLNGQISILPSFSASISSAQVGTQDNSQSSNVIYGKVGSLLTISFPTLLPPIQVISTSFKPYLYLQEKSNIVYIYLETTGHASALVGQVDTNGVVWLDLFGATRGSGSPLTVYFSTSDIKILSDQNNQPIETSLSLFSDKVQKTTITLDYQDLLKRLNSA
jgi:hypothetical protein